MSICSHRIGLELLKLPKAKGTRGQIVGRKKGSGGRGKKYHSSGGTKMAPPDENAPTLEDLKMTRRVSARYYCGVRATA
jgi:hypothetical protein